jgi:glycosidase
MAERRLTDLNLQTLIQGRTFFPSPPAWEDQVLYFLLVDRFSDNNENNYLDNNGHMVSNATTAVFQASDRDNAVQTAGDAATWRHAGAGWNGGTIKGLESKLGYLKRLGVTAIWISPVFKQVNFQETYHGYGPQDFLEIAPRFGTRTEFKQLVASAHALGLYVILDIILNHAGNVFGYNANRYLEHDEAGNPYMDPRWDGHLYAVKGYHDKSGNATLPFGTLNLTTHAGAWPDGAIWPVELQASSIFSQLGRINNWDHYPEFIAGDFLDLKDIHLGQGQTERYQPSPALKALCEVYKFWIAFADLDGFRVDTVKHMDPGAMRYFTSVIHEFTQRLGKENFYLIGEITGGRKRAFDTLEETGMNAALGIDDIPDKLEYLVKGYRNPQQYFDLFRNSLLVQKESHVWFKNKVVTVFDDHDQIRRGANKARFCAREDGSKLVLNALALNATSLGIPCIYYGTEQRFDGSGDNDRYIREAMFGGAFGAFRSRGRHCFNEHEDTFQQLAKILALRRQKLPLRRGRQFLRQISGDGHDFGFPEMVGGEIRSVVPWSRIFDNQEILLAINTDPQNMRSAWVVIDAGLHNDGQTLQCLFSSDASQIGKTMTVSTRNMNRVVDLTVPVAGFVIYE